MTRVTQDDYLKALEQAQAGLDGEMAEAADDALLLERLNALGDGGALAEGEQAAVMAEPPRERADGKPWGTGGPKQRPLTEAQVRFAQALIEGKTLKAAYREGYPNTQAKDSTIAAAAHRLSKHPRIAAMVSQAWAESVEALVDDVQATRRYVLKSLLHIAQTAEQDAPRLRALEMMARASGVFTPAPVAEDKTLTPEQLKRELAGHLRLLDNVRPLKRSRQPGSQGSVNPGSSADAEGGGEGESTAPAPPAAQA